jgi:hypothetical protein
VAVVTTPMDRVLDLLASALPSYWSNASSSGWGGDRFYLLARPESPEKPDAPAREAPANQRSAPGLWVTFWDSPGDRDEFAAAYPGTPATRCIRVPPPRDRSRASPEEGEELAKALSRLE